MKFWSLALLVCLCVVVHAVIPEPSDESNAKQLPFFDLLPVSGHWNMFTLPTLDYSLNLWWYDDGSGGVGPGTTYTLYLLVTMRDPPAGEVFEHTVKLSYSGPGWYNYTEWSDLTQWQGLGATVGHFQGFLAYRKDTYYRLYVEIKSVNGTTLNTGHELTNFIIPKLTPPAPMSVHTLVDQFGLNVPMIQEFSWFPRRLRFGLHTARIKIVNWPYDKSNQYCNYERYYCLLSHRSITGGLVARHVSSEIFPVRMHVHLSKSHTFANVERQHVCYHSFNDLQYSTQYHDGIKGYTHIEIYAGAGRLNPNSPVNFNAYEWTEASELKRFDYKDQLSLWQTQQSDQQHQDILCAWSAAPEGEPNLGRELTDEKFGHLELVIRNVTEPMFIRVAVETVAGMGEWSNSTSFGGMSIWHQKFLATQAWGTASFSTFLQEECAKIPHATPADAPTYCTCVHPYIESWNKGHLSCQACSFDAFTGHNGSCFQCPLTATDEFTQKLHVDCEGTPWGPAQRDACGVCKGDSTTCMDCTGTIFGNKTVDACGVCGGNNTICHAGCPPQHQPKYHNLIYPNGEPGQHHFCERCGMNEYKISDGSEACQVCPNTQVNRLCAVGLVSAAKYYISWRERSYDPETRSSHGYDINGMLNGFLLDVTGSFEIDPNWQCEDSWALFPDEVYTEQNICSECVTPWAQGYTSCPEGYGRVSCNQTHKGQCEICPVGKQSQMPRELTETWDWQRVARMRYATEPRCYDCPLDSYQALSGQILCTLCPANSFTLTTGSTSLSACQYRSCPAGQEWRNNECQLCTIGKYSNDSGTTCHPCSDYQYTDSPGATSCLTRTCSDGWVSDVTGGVVGRQYVALVPQIVQGTYLENYPVCRDCESCPKGQYRRNCSGTNPGECIPCVTCRRGNSLCGTYEYAYWTDPADPAHALLIHMSKPEHNSCIDCEACPVGSTRYNCKNTGDPKDKAGVCLDCADFSGEHGTVEWLCYYNAKQYARGCSVNAGEFERGLSRRNDATTSCRTCRSCPLGQHNKCERQSDGLVLDRCEACPDGQYGIQPGICADIPDHYYSVQTTITGEYLDDSTAVVELRKCLVANCDESLFYCGNHDLSRHPRCQPYHLPDRACSLSSTPNQCVQCNSCPPGYYADPHNCNCLPAMMYTYSDENSFTSKTCAPCPGQVRVGCGGSSAGTCIDYRSCPQGLIDKYRDLVEPIQYAGQDFCDRCPDGTYNLEGDQACEDRIRFCPLGTEFVLMNNSKDCYLDNSCYQCKKCPSRWYRNAHISRCKSCPHGKYSTDEGATECTDHSAAPACGGGQYRSAVDVFVAHRPAACTNQQDACDPGYEATAPVDGSSLWNCIICPVGKFRTNIMPSCQECVSSISPYAGMSECFSSNGFCLLGFQYNQNKGRCEACPTGFYSGQSSVVAGNSDGVCYQCPNGKTTTLVGPKSSVSSCVDCQIEGSETVLVNGEMVCQCPSNQAVKNIDFDDTGYLFKMILGGFGGSSGLKCEACSNVRTWSSSDGDVYQYNDGTGAMYQTRMNWCVSCKVGEYLDVNSKECLLCPVGKANSVLKSRTRHWETECVDCPAGKSTHRVVVEEEYRQLLVADDRDWNPSTKYFCDLSHQEITYEDNPYKDIPHAITSWNYFSSWDLREDFEMAGTNHAALVKRADTHVENPLLCRITDWKQSYLMNDEFVRTFQDCWGCGQNFYSAKVIPLGSSTEVQVCQACESGKYWDGWYPDFDKANRNNFKLSMSKGQTYATENSRLYENAIEKSQCKTCAEAMVGGAPYDQYPPRPWVDYTQNVYKWPNDDQTSKYSGGFYWYGAGGRWRPLAWRWPCYQHPCYATFEFNTYKACKQQCTHTIKNPNPQNLDLSDWGIESAEGIIDNGGCQLCSHGEMGGNQIEGTLNWDGSVTPGDTNVCVDCPAGKSSALPLENDCLPCDPCSLDFLPADVRGWWTSYNMNCGVKLSDANEVKNDPLRYDPVRRLVIGRTAYSRRFSQGICKYVFRKAWVDYSGCKFDLADGGKASPDTNIYQYLQPFMVDINGGFSQSPWCPTYVGSKSPELSVFHYYNKCHMNIGNNPIPWRWTIQVTIDPNDFENLYYKAVDNKDIDLVNVDLVLEPWNGPNTPDESKFWLSFETHFRKDEYIDTERQHATWWYEDGELKYILATCNGAQHPLGAHCDCWNNACERAQQEKEASRHIAGIQSAMLQMSDRDFRTMYYAFQDAGMCEFREVHNGVAYEYGDGHMLWEPTSHPDGYNPLYRLNVCPASASRHSDPERESWIDLAFMRVVVVPIPGDYLGSVSNFFTSWTSQVGSFLSAYGDNNCFLRGGFLNVFSFSQPNSASCQACDDSAYTCSRTRSGINSPSVATLPSDIVTFWGSVNQCQKFQVGHTIRNGIVTSIQQVPGAVEYIVGELFSF